MVSRIVNSNVFFFLSPCFPKLTLRTLLSFTLCQSAWLQVKFTCKRWRWKELEVVTEMAAPMSVCLIQHLLKLPFAVILLSREGVLFLFMSLTYYLKEPFKHATDLLLCSGPWSKVAYAALALMRRCFEVLVCPRYSLFREWEVWQKLMSGQTYGTSQVTIAQPMDDPACNLTSCKLNSKGWCTY